MAYSINRVTLLGNISQDPELTYTPNGTALLKFSMATNQSIRNEAGDWEDKPSFHRVVVWAKTAEALGGILNKGDKVYVDGRIEYGSYEGKDGVKRYTTDIVAQNVITMATRGGSSSDSSSAPSPKKQTEAPKDEPSSKPKKGKEDVKVDDIPF